MLSSSKNAVIVAPLAPVNDVAVIAAELIAPVLIALLVPVNVFELSVASAMKTNSEAESSYPIKPFFAAEPLCQLNLIPLSKLSSLEIEGSPISKIGSSTWTVVLFTVVVVPFTVSVPETTASPVIVTVDDVISSEFNVPVTVKSPPIVTSSGKPI